MLLAALQPSRRPLQRLLYVGAIGRIGSTLIKSHDDIGTERLLYFDAFFGRKHVRRPVDVRAECDALFCNFAKVPEAEHLEASAVGQNRAVPVHKRMQAAGLPYNFVPGTEIQMIGVRKQNVRAFCT